MVTVLSGYTVDSWTPDRVVVVVTVRVHFETPDSQPGDDDDGSDYGVCGESRTPGWVDRVTMVTGS